MHVVNQQLNVLCIVLLLYFFVFHFVICLTQLQFSLWLNVSGAGSHLCSQLIYDTNKHMYTLLDPLALNSLNDLY